MNIKKTDVVYFTLCIVILFLVSLIRCSVKEDRTKIRKIGYPQRIIETERGQQVIVEFHDYVLDTTYIDTLKYKETP